MRNQDFYSYEYQLNDWLNQGFDYHYADRLAKFMSEAYGLRKFTESEKRTFSAMERFNHMTKSHPNFKNRVQIAIAIMNGRADNF
jgi:hypothetical protein